MKTTYIAKIFISLDNGDKILYNEIHQPNSFETRQLNEMLNDCLLQVSHSSRLPLYKIIIFTNHIATINIETSVDYHY